MRRRVGILGALVAAVMMIAGVAVAAGHLIPSNTDIQDVLWFADESQTGGESVLTRTSGMVTVTVEANGLKPGNAHTLWWVVFNNPSACSDPCGEDDIFNPDGTLNVAQVQAAQIGVGNATGNVAKADGTAEFGGRLKVNDTTGAHQILFPAGLSGNALLTVSGNDAEVHLVVQSHGQGRSGKALLDQLTFAQTGCTSTCEDIQFAVHKP